MASCGEQEECKVVNGTAICESQTCPFKGNIYKPWPRGIYVRCISAVRNVFVIFDEVYMQYITCS